MPFAFVVAMGGVGFEDVAVAGFQFFDDSGFIYRTGPDIISQSTEKNRILTIFIVHGTELFQIFSQECVGFALSQGAILRKTLTRQDSMTISVVRSVLELMKSLEFLDYQNGPLKERQSHDTSFGGEGWRCDRDGHYRHKKYQDFFHKPMGVMVPGLMGVMIPGVLPPLSSPLSLLLNSNVCCHGVDPKLSSIHTPNFTASDELAV